MHLIGSYLELVNSIKILITRHCTLDLYALWKHDHNPSELAGNFSVVNFWVDEQPKLNGPSKVNLFVAGGVKLLESKILPKFDKTYECIIKVKSNQANHILLMAG